MIHLRAFERLPKRCASGPLGDAQDGRGTCHSPPGAGGGPVTAAGRQGIRDFAADGAEYVAEAAPRRKETGPRARPVWDKVAERVEGLLTASTRWTAGKQRLTATRLHELLVAEGHAVGVTVVKAAVAGGSGSAARSSCR